MYMYFSLQFLQKTKPHKEEQQQLFLAKKPQSLVREQHKILAKWLCINFK